MRRLCSVSNETPAIRIVRIFKADPDFQNVGITNCINPERPPDLACYFGSQRIIQQGEERFARLQEGKDQAAEWKC